MTATRGYRILDHLFSIEVDGPEAWLDQVFDPLRSTAAGSPADRYTVTYQVDGLVVLGSARATSTSRRPAAVAQQLLTEVLGQAIPEDLPYVRGAVLSVEGQGILVVGASGSGVSTLAVELLRSGAALVSEQIVVLDDDGPRSMPLPIMLTKGSMELLDVEVPDDCGCGKYAHPVERFGGVSPAVPPIGVVVVLDAAASGIEPVSQATAMTTILRHNPGHALDDALGAERLGRLLAGARCFVAGHAPELAGRLLSATMLRPAGGPVLTEVIDGGTATFLAGEAVLLVDGAVRHLDATAAGLWVLATEGLSDDEIASELGASSTDVARGLDRLRASGVPL